MNLYALQHGVIVDGIRNPAENIGRLGKLNDELATKYESEDKQPGLARSLRFFSGVLTNRDASMAERVEVSKQVRATVVATKSSQSPDEQRLFKADRRLIKAAQKELVPELSEQPMSARFR